MTGAESAAVAAVRRELEAVSAEHESELSALGESTRNSRQQAEAGAKEAQERFQALASRVREIAAERDRPHQQVETLDFSPEDDEDAPPQSEFEREANELATMIPRAGTPAEAGAEPAAAQQPPEAQPPTPAPQPPPQPQQSRAPGHRRVARDLDDEEDMSEHTWLT